MVDYYGTPTPLKQMGNINSPEPRLLTISLWDPKAIPLVEKAIQKSDLGMNPSNDGKVIRLVVPELNEERRKELTKVVRKGAEEAKVAMRNTRRDAMEQIKKLKKDSLITEDDQRKAEDELQKLTDARHQGDRQDRRRKGKGDHGGLTDLLGRFRWKRRYPLPETRPGQGSPYRAPVQLRPDPAGRTPGCRPAGSRLKVDWSARIFDPGHCRKVRSAIDPHPF